MCTHTHTHHTHTHPSSQVVLVVKKKKKKKILLANAGDIRDEVSIPGSGRSPGGGNGNLLQYSSRDSHMARKAWQAIVHRVAKNQTQLSD